MSQTSHAIERQVSKSIEKLVYAHWDLWDAKSYLKTYFLKLGQDSDENLKFIVRELKKLTPDLERKILDFGSGPTIFAGIAAAPYAKKIDICDYLGSNLVEIKKWLASDKNAFDWTLCIKHILRLEGLTFDDASANERSNLLKRKMGRIFRSDASLDWPIFSITQEKYPVVISNFCADSATSSKEVWRAYMKNIFNLVEYEGKILVTALRNCNHYRNGDRLFPSANVNEIDLKNVLIENGFPEKDLLIEVRPVLECINEGFTTIMCASATKTSKKEGEILQIFKTSSGDNLSNVNTDY